MRKWCRRGWFTVLVCQEASRPSGTVSARPIADHSHERRGPADIGQSSRRAACSSPTGAEQSWPVHETTTHASAHHQRDDCPSPSRSATYQADPWVRASTPCLVLSRPRGRDPSCWHLLRVGQGLGVRHDCPFHAPPATRWAWDEPNDTPAPAPAQARRNLRLTAQPAGGAESREAVACPRAALPGELTATLDVLAARVSGISRTAPGAQPGFVRPGARGGDRCFASSLG
jgi:hypothetical protein